MLMLWEISITLKGMYFVVCLFKSRVIFQFERKKKYEGLLERQVQVDIQWFMQHGAYVLSVQILRNSL